MKDDDIVIEHTEINEYINNYREEWYKWIIV
jgi:hypothetical protein